MQEYALHYLLLEFIKKSIDIFLLLHGELDMLNEVFQSHNMTVRHLFS